MRQSIRLDIRYKKLLIYSRRKAISVAGTRYNI